MTPEEMEALKRSRRGRNVALGLVLLFLVILFYAVAWAKIAG